MSGFLQDRSSPTGMVRLWRDLHETVSPGSQLLLLNWNDNVEEYASLILQFARETNEPEVSVFGYSWGGATACNFARSLQRRGLNVGCMVLSDPVYRHWWLPRRWTSMLSWMVIPVPANTRQVHWFRQRTNVPMGHDLVAEDPRKTKIHDPVIVTGVAHQYMDDLRAFHAECHKCAAA